MVASACSAACCAARCGIFFWGIPADPAEPFGPASAAAAADADGDDVRSTESSVGGPLTAELRVRNGLTPSFG